jgi:hypothetical protein
MRSKNLLWSVLLGSLAVAGLAACSSDDSNGSPPALHPFDAGEPAVTEAGPGAGPVQVNIVGAGSVQSGDVVQSDGGGPVGTVVCTNATGAMTTGSCSAPQMTTLYAIPAVGWQFQKWTTTTPTDFSSFYSLQVGTGTPNPIVAVSVSLDGGTATPDAGPAPDSGPAPDAGHDSGAADSGPVDSGAADSGAADSGPGDAGGD